MAIFSSKGVISRLFRPATKTPEAFLRVNPEGVKHRDMLNKLRGLCLAYRDIGKGREQDAVSFVSEKK